MKKRGDLERPSILIVDDQPINVQALANLLKDEYRIKVATSGRKALDIASAGQPPDLVLLDIEMPGLDGYEVCRALKSDPRTSDIAIIFVTARDTAEEEERGLRLGAVDYVSKPFHPAIVRARVRNHVTLKIKTSQLEKLSMRDGLTDIPNRRYFSGRLDQEWQRAQRQQHPLGLIMMDIDHFKFYNDHYGHGAGDECLIQVARTLHERMVRPGDLVARYGGEEFVALLPDTDGSGTLHVADRLRSGVELLALPQAPTVSTRIVTLSLGVASLVPTGDASVERLLRAADRALYQAKAEGRNRICREAEV